MSYNPGGGTGTVSGIVDVPGLSTALDGKQPAGSYAQSTHNHDATYAGAVHAHAGYASAIHPHSVNEITGLQTALDAKQIAGSYATSIHNHDGVYEAAGAVAAHSSAADPHAVYQKETERGVANGYAALDAQGKVPSAQLPSSGSVVGYALNLFALNAATTTDNQTIFWGISAVAPVTTGGLQRVYVPKAGAIKAAYVYANAGTAGTAEAWPCSIRLNNTTNTLIQSITLSNVSRVWANVALNVAVAQGDYLEITMTNPAWATNPANVRFSASIYIE